MPPRRLEVALLELSVVDERGRAGGEGDHGIRIAGEGILSIGRVDKRAIVGLDPERERRCRMEDARRAHAEPPDLLVAPVLQLADGELRRKIVDVDRKERVVHAQAEELAHRARLLGTADAERRLGVVRRTEERNALDVTPVEVRQQDVDGEGPRAAAVHERLAELAEARAGVEDEKRSGAVANLDARGIAAVAHGERAGRRDGDPGAPEPDLHRLMSWPPDRAPRGPTRARRSYPRRPASATCASWSRASIRDRGRSAAPLRRRSRRDDLRPCRP